MDDDPEQLFEADSELDKQIVENGIYNSLVDTLVNLNPFKESKMREIFYQVDVDSPKSSNDSRDDLDDDDDDDEDSDEGSRMFYMALKNASS